MLLGVGLGDARRPKIGVDDEDHAQRKRAADDAEEELGPDRPLRKAELRAGVAVGENAADDGEAGGDADRPAPSAADPSLARRAADQFEAAVHRRDRLAADDPPRRAVIDDEAAERDDEGG